MNAQEIIRGETLRGFDEALAKGRGRAAAREFALDIACGFGFAEGEVDEWLREHERQQRHGSATDHAG